MLFQRNGVYCTTAELCQSQKNIHFAFPFLKMPAIPRFARDISGLGYARRSRPWSTLLRFLLVLRSVRKENDISLRSCGHLAWCATPSTGLSYELSCYLHFHAVTQNVLNTCQTFNEWSSFRETNLVISSVDNWKRTHLRIGNKGDRR